MAEIYQGLVLATRDYVQRSGFPGVILDYQEVSTQL
jgi:NAD+ synthase (glutamine-hydrolysing)